MQTLQLAAVKNWTTITYCEGNRVVKAHGFQAVHFRRTIVLPKTSFLGFLSCKKEENDLCQSYLIHCLNKKRQ